MQLLATLQLCCASLAAIWAAGVRSVGERSVSLPYFTKEPTELIVDETADVLRRGSSNVYYFSSPSDPNLRLTLECSAVAPGNSLKNIQYYWTLDGAEIPTWSHKTKIVLKAEDFRSQFSKYRCVASLHDAVTRKSRNTSSSQLTLKPGPPYPMNNNRPSSQTKIKCNANSLLTINSSCYMSPVPYIQWNDVDSYIRNGNAYISSTGSLVINCNELKASLIVSVNCFNSLLRFVGGDVYTVLPDYSNVSTKRITQLNSKQHLTYTVGDSVYFACRSALTVPNPQVKFYKNKLNSLSSVEIGVNRPYLTFIQMNVTLEDAGKYYCEVTSSNSESTPKVIREEMELQVYSPPYWILKPPSFVYVFWGDTLSLKYEVGGLEANIQNYYRFYGDYSSSKIKMTSQSYSDRRPHQLGQSYSLELSFVNELGELFASVAVMVVKRMSILKPEKHVDLSTGKVVLKCDVEFDWLLERPQAFWKFPSSNHILDNNSRTCTNTPTNDIVQVELEISVPKLLTFSAIRANVTYRDIVGVYHCIFNASHGIVNQSIHLTTDDLNPLKKFSSSGSTHSLSTSIPTNTAGISRGLLFIIICLSAVGSVTAFSIIARYVSNWMDKEQPAEFTQLGNQEFKNEPWYWRCEQAVNNVSVMRERDSLVADDYAY